MTTLWRSSNVITTIHVYQAAIGTNRFWQTNVVSCFHISANYCRLINLLIQDGMNRRSWNSGCASPNYIYNPEWCEITQVVPAKIVALCTIVLRGRRKRKAEFVSSDQFSGHQTIQGSDLTNRPRDKIKRNEIRRRRACFQWFILRLSLECVSEVRLGKQNC